MGKCMAAEAEAVTQAVQMMNHKAKNTSKYEDTKS
jgi:hypothetical protein